MDYESLIREIWSIELAEPGIAATDDFFDLGGDSFQAIQILSRIRASLGAQVPMALLFQDSTLAGYSMLVAQWHSDRLERSVRCSAGQHGA